MIIKLPSDIFEKNPTNLDAHTKERNPHLLYGNLFPSLLRFQLLNLQTCLLSTSSGQSITSSLFGLVQSALIIL